MTDSILRDILIIFIFSIPVVLIAHRLKIPSIAGFLITGLIIGPHILRLIPSYEDIRILAEVGIALLLFSIGLEFSFDRLRGWARRVIGIGILQIVLTIALGFAAGIALGMTVVESTFLGCAAALSSTAIVMAILSQKRWFDAPAGRISTGILILQDLAVIPMMVFLKFISTPYEGGILDDIALALLKVAGLAVVLVAMSRWILRPLLHHISKPLSRELFVVVIVGLAIGAAFLTERIGLSFALGAFLAGLLISTTEFRFQALSEIAPFRYCFNGLFFVAVGMIVDPGFIVHNWPSVTTLVIFFILVKIFIVGGAIVGFGYPVSVAVIGGLMLAQVGEFSFLLVHFGWLSGAVDQGIYQLIISSAAITMIFAPLIVAIAPTLGKKLAFITWSFKSLRGRRQGTAPDEEEVLDEHAIICGFGPLGMTIGKLLEGQGIKYVVLEINPGTVKRERLSGRRIYLGDGASAALLHHSGIDRARLLAIAIPDYLNSVAIIKSAKRMNPDIFIVARSRYRDQCPSLYVAGADVVVCEELEAGIEMGRYVLFELGVEEETVKKIFKEIRAFGSADFF